MDDFRFQGRCSKCGDQVGDKTVKWSMKKYGKVLCVYHQPKTIEEVLEHFKKKQKEPHKLGIGQRRVNDY